MNRTPATWRSWLALVLLLAGAGARTEPDDAQQAWLEAVEVAPFWDNVRDAPLWVSGPRPRRRAGSLLHDVRLQPGEQVTLQLPPGETLRVQSPAGLLATDGLRAAWSNGSGLFAELALVAATDGRTLTARPPVQTESLLRLHRPAEAHAPLSLALFVSRNPNRELATSYRELLTPLAAGPQTAVDDGSGQVRYWLADRDRPLQLNYQGPTRARIDSRLLLPAEGGAVAESYRIDVYRDGDLLRVIDLATLLDTTPVTLDGCARPVGRPADAYLDLPAASGKLELRVQRPMLLRVLAARSPHDYLIAGNAPKLAAPPARPDSEVHAEAVRIARDNRHPQGGIRAFHTLETLAGRWPAQPQYRALAARRAALHTRFQDLMPQHGAPVGTGLFAWFDTPRLADRQADVQLPESYLHKLAGQLASGFFTEVPREAAQAQSYRIPERLDTSTLRVAVDLAGINRAQGLYLQLDDDPPLHLQLDAGRTPPALALRPSRGALAVAALHRRAGGGTPTLSGAFASRHAAAPLVEAAFVEIPLDRPVERVRVWRPALAEGPLRVALAYRTSGWFSLSEAGYLGLLDAAGEARVAAEMRRALSIPAATGDASVSAGSGDDPAHELYNQWLPLLRFVHARHALFAAGVEQTRDNAPPGPATPAALAGMLRQARAAEAAGDWQTALQQWSRLQRRAGGELQPAARSGQVRALRMLDENFLADQLLRHDLLYAADAALRDQALRGLVESAAAEQDPEVVLGVRAAAAVRDPSVANLRALADALVTVGRERFALQLLLAIPAAQRPPEALLEAAYGLGWWRLFDRTLTTLDDPRHRALWRGYRSQLQGDFAAAQAHWVDAGEPGQTLAAHLAAGIEIRRGLGLPDAAERRRALLAWEDWQERTPGPRQWRDAAPSVTANAGTRSVVNHARGEFDTLFRATPDEPLRLAVYGPTRLRLTARPLHRAADGTPVNDWLIVHGAGTTSRQPVIDNDVAAGLRLAGDERQLPGLRVEIVRQVPAGYHEFTLHATRHELLVAVATDAPRRPLSVLPLLTPYTAQHALMAATGRASGKEPLPGPAFDLGLFDGCTVRPATVPYPAVASAQPARRVDAASGAWFDELQTLRGSPPQPSDQGSAKPLSERLAGLLWEAEQAPERYAAALTEAERLAEADTATPGVQAILRRLREPASWRLLHTVQESAGVRLVEFDGWQPESPALRIRKALLGVDTANEQLMSGHDTRVLSLYNREPVTVGLTLSLVEAALQRAPPMRVLVSWDDDPPAPVVLDAARPEARVTREVGAGQHALRLRIADPLANQFLRIRVTERRGSGARVITEPVSRSYSLASREQPLVLLARGPTRLRIDEWRDGRTLVSYRTVAEGWQRIVVPVEAGREESLLRVFSQTLEHDRPSSALRRSAYQPQPLADAPWRSPAMVDLAAPALADARADGWPGDGTWSLNLGFTSRRTLDDEPRAASAAERFATLGASYRRYMDERHGYFEGDAGVRLREHGDPVLALRTFVSLREEQWPLNLDLAGRLFLQRVDASGGLESAATVRARLSRQFRLGEKTSHSPSLALFQRWLSLDRLPPDAATTVDQDIFTGYKRSHDRGLRVGDRIQHQPWLDTLLYAGAELVSNEDLNLAEPDHLGLRLGARQLLADLDVGLSYEQVRYFADDDRARNSDSQRLRLDAMFHRWLSPRRGVRAGLAYEYDHDSGDSSLSLVLSLDLANGRYYRDFRPGELDFRQVRQRSTLERHVREGWE